MAGFPPKSTYPTKIDTDETLYLVYNTSEARTTVDVAAWSDEIEIVPVAADAPELWADNGFANIEGELFYYDSVAKNDDDKVYKLKRCIRGWGGKEPKFNSSGTYVRGFVVAEHHNQLVDAAIKIEKFIQPLALDVADLIEEELTDDDHKCPDVDFQFNINSTSNTGGTSATYEVTITGAFTLFKIDFGDGTTSTLRTGTHNYPPNSTIDPVVIVENNNCSTVITPSNRTPSVEPQITQDTVDFQLPLIPDPIEIPELNFTFPGLPETTFTMPPSVGPCFNLGPLGPINVPSVILVKPPINIPSRISFSPINIPSRISILSRVTIPSLIRFANVPSKISLIGPKIPSLIRFANIPKFPSRISFVGVNIPSVIQLAGGSINIPSRIQITGNIPSRITLSESIPSKITITGKIPKKISFGKPPKISVKWGKPPKISVIMVCPSSTPEPAFRSMDYKSDPYSSEGFAPVGNSTPVISANITDLGIPTEIKIVAPVFPTIKHDIPTEIKVTGIKIPSLIKIRGPKTPIPSEIRIRSKIPSQIVVKSTLPKSIKLDATDVPKVIKLDVPKEFPKIQFDLSTFPKSIKLDTPDTIKVDCRFPTEITAKLTLPENISVPLVYNGGPIPFRFDDNRVNGDNDYPCFAIIPCPKK
jgi:PKD repeat protein